MRKSPQEKKRPSGDFTQNNTEVMMMDHQRLVNEIIPAKLKEIEERENVRILHCVESGSRAWGFPSPDSDYDVRFIYVRPMEYYLRLEQTRDVIEWQLDDTLDINGWDLKKALQLAHSSNPTLFEWDKSPIVYKTTSEWAAVSSVICSYFSKISGMHHYLSTARKNYKEYFRGETVKLKKYFYVLRPILACRWILEKQSPPPILFSELMEACLDESLLPAVNSLLKIKTETPEVGYGERIDIIDKYLESSIEELETKLYSLPRAAKPSWETLNSLFMEMIR